MCVCVPLLPYVSALADRFTFRDIGHDAKQHKRKLLEEINDKLSALTEDAAKTKEEINDKLSALTKDAARVKEIQQLLADEKPAKRFSPSPSGVSVRQPESLRASYSAYQESDCVFTFEFTHTNRVTI